MTTLVEALGYTPTEPNVAQRGVQALASTPQAAWILSRLLAPTDRWLLRISGGRTTAAGLMTGIPVITLTTTGARSGLPRSSPLVGVPIEGSLAVVGTNYGQKANPAWVFNLAAHPKATVTYRTTTVPVRARPADDAEYEEVFERAAGIYPGYDDYRTRVTDRPIRVFILDHVPDTATQ